VESNRMELFFHVRSDPSVDRNNDTSSLCKSFALGWNLFKELVKNRKSWRLVEMLFEVLWILYFGCPYYDCAGIFFGICIGATISHLTAICVIDRMLKGEPFGKPITKIFEPLKKCLSWRGYWRQVCLEKYIYLYRCTFFFSPWNFIQIPYFS